ncbi:acyloxyacyl hydrolase [Formosa sp. S-31]|uniref:acyloxyacyl hydrolase n=1 Tax=Formosa sp. S-31 TaxID=2790949 RepID=UPI003EBEB34E
MKQIFIFLLILVFGPTVQAQEKSSFSYFDFNYFRGNIALHNKNILHLIVGHPEGFILGWNKKTFGDEAWQQGYNYPDYGVSLSYQNLKNKTLGNNVGIYAHYNFYFLRRHLMLRVGQGLAYNSNPYDKYNNYKNTAFGTTILSSTYFMLNYKKERVFDKFGVQAGATLIHYSNANVKAPNASINSIVFNVGLTYNLDQEDPEYNYVEQHKVTEPIKYNIAFRAGINESDIIGMGQFPFYVVSAYADKRLSRKSAVQFGGDFFFSKFLNELIAYNVAAFPERGTDPDADYKRAGLFLGHELFINKMSVITQLGYYVYYPFDFEGRTYMRLGLKRYFGEKWFGAVTLKSHGAKAECVEFGIGVRL